MDVARVGYDPRFLGTDSAKDTEFPRVLVGTCFAFDAAQLVRAHEGGIKAWHTSLLEHSVVGLRQEKSRQRVLMGYQVLSKLLRVFVLSKKEGSWAKLYQSLGKLPGYIESGADGVPIEELRPFAYWEWPDILVALWPVGDGGDTAQPRVVDTATLLSYRSVREAEMAMPVDTAGPDYVRVPSVPEAKVAVGHHEYRYVNRWVLLDRTM